MFLNDEARTRLATLCQRLRNGKSARAFTREHNSKLGGITHSTWSAWERKEGGLSNDTISKLINFVGCSEESFQGYLGGFVSLEELLLSPLASDTPQASNFSEFSDKVLEWMKVLPVQELAKVLSSGMSILNKRLSQQSDKPSILDLIRSNYSLVLEALGDINVEQMRLDEILRGESKPTEEEWLIIKHVLPIADNQLEEMFRQQFCNGHQKHRGCHTNH